MIKARNALSLLADAVADRQTELKVYSDARNQSDTDDLKTTGSFQIHSRHVAIADSILVLRHRVRERYNERSHGRLTVEYRRKRYKPKLIISFPDYEDKKAKINTEDDQLKENTALCGHQFVGQAQREPQHKRRIGA
eukprot:IDg15945t1